MKLLKDRLNHLKSDLAQEQNKKLNKIVNQEKVNEHKQNQRTLPRGR